MRFNLKTRPHHVNDIMEFDRWFEGFEKELRETLEWLDKWHPRTIQNLATKDSWKHTILEVLGEP